MPNNLCLASPTSYYTAQWRLILALIYSKPINRLVAYINLIPIIEPTIGAIVVTVHYTEIMYYFDEIPVLPAGKISSC